MRFQFPFILIGKSTMAFLTDQSWRVLKYGYTAGGPEQGFRRCSVSSVAQATVNTVEGRQLERIPVSLGFRSTFESFLSG